MEMWAKHLVSSDGLYVPSLIVSSLTITTMTQSTQSVFRDSLLMTLTAKFNIPKTGIISWVPLGAQEIKTDVFPSSFIDSSQLESTDHSHICAFTGKH